MNNIFLSFKFTGEPYDTNRRELKKIKESLEFYNNNVYCSLFDNMISEYTQEHDMWHRIFGELDEREHLILYVKQNSYVEEIYSLGMNKEVERAKQLDKHITLLTPSHVYMPHYEKDAHRIVSYNNLDDLCHKLQIMYS